MHLTIVQVGEHEAMMLSLPGNRLDESNHNRR